MNQLITLFLALALSACATRPLPNDIVGTIVGLQPFVAQESAPNITGGVIGAGAGGLLGNQVGRGNGKIAATLIGAGLGAAIGSQIGKETRNVNMLEIAVRDEQGSIYRVQQLNDFGGWAPGLAVRIKSLPNGQKQVTF